MRECAFNRKSANDIFTGSDFCFSCLAIQTSKYIVIKYRPLSLSMHPPIMCFELEQTRLIHMNECSYLKWGYRFMLLNIAAVCICWLRLIEIYIYTIMVFHSSVQYCYFFIFPELRQNLFNEWDKQIAKKLYKCFYLGEDWINFF